MKYAKVPHGLGGTSNLADDPFPELVLVVGGILSVFIAVYGKRDDSHLDELGTIFGFILGAVIGIMAVLVVIEESVNWFTLTVMVLLAVTLFLKPMKDIPWAGIAGLIAGAAAAYGVSLLLHDRVSGTGLWVALAVTFLIVGTIVHVGFKFIEDLLKITRMILDWKPVMVVVGIVAVVEGLLILAGGSLISLF